MKTSNTTGYIKRTQKDHSFSFKLQIVEEVEQGFLTKSQAKTKYGIQSITTDSHHRFRKYKNSISNIDIQVWFSDITYIRNRTNSFYLALITDVYSKKMGYNLSNSLNVADSIEALEIALKNRNYNENHLIHNSDRGLQILL